MPRNNLHLPPNRSTPSRTNLLRALSRRYHQAMDRRANNNGRSHLRDHQSTMDTIQREALINGLTLDEVVNYHEPDSWNVFGDPLDMRAVTSHPQSVAIDQAIIDELHEGVRSVVSNMRPVEPSPELTPGAVNYVRDIEEEVRRSVIFGESDLPSAPITASEVRQRSSRYWDEVETRIQTDRSTWRQPEPSGRHTTPRQQEPAWKKFPCLIDFDKRQSGKTTRLLKEMQKITDTECFFLSPSSERARNAMELFHTIVTEDKDAKKDIASTKITANGNTYYFRAYNQFAERYSGKAVFIDDLDECIKHMYRGNTVVNVTWTNSAIV